jgi:hypothetical protein
MSQHVLGTISITGGIPYADWVKIQNASDGTATTVAPTTVAPTIAAPTTDIVIEETLEYESDRTEMRAVFTRGSDRKYIMTYEAKMSNHSSTSKIDNWTKRIHAILEGKAIQSVITPSYWSSDSHITFLKIACLCNRVDDVQNVFQCSQDMLDAAQAWARGHGIVHIRTWAHKDELTIRDHKLKFTLQKWSDGSNITCVRQLITGNDRTTIEELSTIMRDIIGWVNNGNHCIHAQYSDVYARAAIFADAVSRYKLLSNRSSEDLTLAKKYESKCMIEHLTQSVMREWKIPTASYGVCTLVKKYGVVTCAQLPGVVEQVINNCINLYNIQGGPQLWAEIAAFADNAQSLTTSQNFASNLGVCLDNKRINDALAAGRVA